MARLRARRPGYTRRMIVGLLALVLLALAMGVGTVVQGLLWLASVTCILVLVVVAVVVSRLRPPGPRARRR